MEGQLDVLSELQALLVEEEGGCGHMAPASTQTALPGMMGYMASTRFGPSFYTTFVQQVQHSKLHFSKMLAHALLWLPIKDQEHCQ